MCCYWFFFDLHMCTWYISINITSPFHNCSVETMSFLLSRTKVLANTLKYIWIYFYSYCTDLGRIWKKFYYISIIFLAMLQYILCKLVYVEWTYTMNITWMFFFYLKLVWSFESLIYWANSLIILFFKTNANIY